MDGMAGMGDGAGALAPLDWGTFFSTWELKPVWLAVAAVLLGGYLAGRVSAGPRSTVRPWRVVSFGLGTALLWVCVASAIGTYAMSLFWMHMVLHLLLIMVVPVLLVLGHPLTVLLEAFPPERQPRVRAALRSWPVSVLTHQTTGLLLYAVVIIGTHLTGFMDQMAQHAWLMTGEQVLYVVTGYLFLLPLLGEEPIRANPSYLLRLMILVAAMIPDTVVGIVLLQTDHVPFPVMMSMHPDWAPPALHDTQVGGALMWAAGDGLMMAIGIGLWVSVLSSPSRRERVVGTWLEGVRRATLVEHVEQSGAQPLSREDADLIDADSDEALDAYNRMLARLREHEA